MKRLIAHWWTDHPGVRSHHELSLGERAADRMRLGMGSWPFVFAAVVFLAAWMTANIALAARGGAFDPYPFILLNLVLSCLAALQGAILLIAAKRSDQISAELATHTHENTAQLVTMNERQLEILELLVGHRATPYGHLWPELYGQSAAEAEAGEPQ
jgi:uncharacterized membrane protein